MQKLVQLITNVFMQLHVCKRMYSYDYVRAQNCYIYLQMNCCSLQLRKLSQLLLSPIYKYILNEMKQLSTNECILQYCTVCITNKIQLSSNEEKQLFVDDFYTIHTIQYSHLRMKCIQFHTLESMKLSANELKLMKLINKKMQLSLIN